MANKKKTNKRKKKKANNKNNLKIILPVVIIFLIVLVILIVILLGNKKIECTKTVSENDFKTNSKVLVYYKNDNINKIEVNKKIKISNNDNGVNYLSMVKSSMDNLYKEMKLDYKLTQKNNSLDVNIIYEKDEKYIIDNVYIEKETEGISFNVIKEDTNNSYATFDLSKKYYKNDILNIFKSAGYMCK